MKCEMEKDGGGWTMVQRTVWDPDEIPTLSRGRGRSATTVDGRDRRRLERVCRYLLRPPFAHDAIEALADGRVRVHFKAPSRRGAAFADMTVDTFLSRLCARQLMSVVVTIEAWIVRDARRSSTAAIPDTRLHEAFPRRGMSAFDMAVQSSLRRSLGAAGEQSVALLRDA